MQGRGKFVFQCGRSFILDLSVLNCICVNIFHIFGRYFRLVVVLVFVCLLGLFVINVNFIIYHSLILTSVINLVLWHCSLSMIIFFITILAHFLCYPCECSVFVNIVFCHLSFVVVVLYFLSVLFIIFCFSSCYSVLCCQCCPLPVLFAADVALCYCCQSSPFSCFPVLSIVCALCHECFPLLLFFLFVICCPFLSFLVLPLLLVLFVTLCWQCSLSMLFFVAVLVTILVILLSVLSFGVSALCHWYHLCWQCCPLLSVLSFEV